MIDELHRHAAPSLERPSFKKSSRKAGSWTIATMTVDEVPWRADNQPPDTRLLQDDRHLIVPDGKPATRAAREFTQCEFLRTRSNGCRFTSRGRSTSIINQVIELAGCQIVIAVSSQDPHRVNRRGVSGGSGKGVCSVKIAVLVKEVPDTWGDRRLNLETGLLDRVAAEPVVDEINERALEVALSFAETQSDVEVIALAVGPASVPTSLRKALAMGADRAVHVLDDGLVGADLTLTAQVIAAAITHIGCDLVIAGNVSTDGGAGAMPSLVAELLDLPAATYLSTIEISADAVSGRRDTETGTFVVRAALPAVISVTEALPDARFPNFKGIMAAKKKPFDTLSLGDLGLAATDESRSIVIAVTQRPARTAGEVIVDEGDAGQQVADFLAKNKLI